MRGGSVCVETTLPGTWNEAEVGAFASALVESGSAACVQIRRIRSVYRWQGRCESEEEWSLSIKTSEGAAPRLIERILADHPYDLPQITTHPIGTTDGYGEWIVSETDAGSGDDDA